MKELKPIAEALEAVEEVIRNIGETKNLPEVLLAFELKKLL